MLKDTEAKSYNCGIRPLKLFTDKPITVLIIRILIYNHKTFQNAPRHQPCKLMQSMCAANTRHLLAGKETDLSIQIDMRA